MRSDRVNKLAANARRGTALVEMALALIILLLLAMGAIEYGWLFLKQQQITNAARQAARLASTADATTADVDSQITTLMNSYGLGSTGYAKNYSWDGELKSIARGTTVSVQISVAYSKVTITNSSLLPMPATVSATVAMQKEGP